MSTQHSTKIRPGVWRTDGGSELTITAIRDNLVEGTYRSAQGQPDTTETFPVTGFVNGDLIGFVCSWGPAHQSMTSWCGRFGLDNGRPCIRSVWHLGRTYADRAHTQKNEYWESFISYTGTYYLQK